MIDENKKYKKEDKHPMGSCLCGSVKFKLNGKLRNVINCHCGQCMRTHGHYAAYTAIEKKDLEFLNDDGLKWYHSSSKARRGFCKICGASIFFDRFGRETISIAAGMLSFPEILRTSEHIFFDEKRDYYEIYDKLPKFSQYYLERLEENFIN